MYNIHFIVYGFFFIYIFFFSGLPLISTVLLFYLFIINV